MRYLVSCAVFIAMFVAPVQAADLLYQIGKLVDKASSLLQQRSAAPNSSWNPLATTKGDYDKDFNALLDKILVQLCDDNILEVKNKINRLRENNAKSEKIISDLIIRRIESPRDKSWYEVHKTTKESIDQKISDEKKTIEERTKIIENLKKEIKSRLKNEKSLRNISNEQLDSLFYTVMGESSLELIVVLKNLINLIDILKNNLIDSGENIHIAKKYYGIYYIMTESYVRQHDIVLNRTDKIYEPELRSIIAENKKLMEQTRKLLSQDNNYKSNYNSQQITEKTADLYLRRLQVQRREVEKSRAKAMKMATLAENTYRTVNIAQRLGQVMLESQKEYEQLLSLQIPELISFENKEMEQEFLKLTERLQAASMK